MPGENRFERDSGTLLATEAFRSDQADTSSVESTFNSAPLISCESETGCEGRAVVAGRGNHCQANLHQRPRQQGDRTQTPDLAKQHTRTTGHTSISCSFLPTEPPQGKRLTGQRHLLSVRIECAEQVCDRPRVRHPRRASRMAARDQKDATALLQHGADPQLARILPWSLGCGQTMIRSGTRPGAATGHACQSCGLEFFLASSNANGARGRRPDTGRLSLARRSGAAIAATAKKCRSTTALRRAAA